MFHVKHFFCAEAVAGYPLTCNRKKTIIIIEKQLSYDIIKRRESRDRCKHSAASGALGMTERAKISAEML